MALSLDGTTGISASGNIWGNNIIVPGTLTVGSFSPSALSTAGNITGGNLITGGLISAAGNVIAANLTGTLTTAAQTNITLLGTLSSLSVSGNVQGGNIRTVGLISAAGNVQAGNVIAGANVSAANIDVSGQISATGNITGNYVLGNGSQLTGIDATSIQNGTSNVRVVSSGGNITVGVGGSSNVAVFATTGIFVTGSVSASGNITGLNINSSNADLAEMYVADEAYAPGTVVEFGGSQEIKATTQTHSTRVAGVISTAPSYLMNKDQAGEHVLPVALTGRVPCQVVGVVSKGDCLVSSSVKGTAQALDLDLHKPGCIIGKALENYSSDQVGVIEIVVGKN